MKNNPRSGQYLDKRLGDFPITWGDLPKGWNMRVHELILNSVVFLGRRSQWGNGQEDVLTGTGFVVRHRLKSPTGARVRDFHYLVTGRHVAEKLAPGNGDADWFIRHNKNLGTGFSADYAVGQTRFSKAGQWYFHPDPTQVDSVDVAVMRWPVTDARMSSIPTFMFATTKKLSERWIGIGSETLTVGLFTKMTGNRRNIPLVRSGMVAMMPDEKVPGVEIGDWRGESEVFLIESRSLGGVSGSPVFVVEEQYPTLPAEEDKEAATICPSGPTYLLGLMNGHWEIKEPEINSIYWSGRKGDRESIATGISVVVPAQKILEVLDHPDLVAERSRIEAEDAEGQSTTQL